MPSGKVLDGVGEPTHADNSMPSDTPAELAVFVGSRIGRSIINLPPKAGLGTRVLDRLLDDFLHLVPVVGVDPLDFRVEKSLDLVEQLPLVAVRHERDRDAHTAESSGTTDTVQVGLAVGLALAAGLVQLGDILLN